MRSGNEELAHEVVAAVADGDPARARLLLHPYLHWIECGTTVGGRSNVLALLAERTCVAPPVEVELRDGQIYRWLGDG